MKIYTLAENTALDGFTPEHGLSLYIETGDKRILFDTGASGIMADHARRLGIDLSRVDAVILSHGHYDHGGGLMRFLQCNATAPVYISRHAFGDYRNAGGKYIGLEPALRSAPSAVLTDGTEELFPGVFLHGSISCHDPVDSAGLQTVTQGHWCPDPFDHEQYLLIREQGRTFCFSGCAHRGVVNIARHFRPDVLIGGFHFKHLPQGSPEVEAAARKLLALGCECYTGHCTGAQHDPVLQGILGEKLHYLCTGGVFSP